jgi:hypothetical protein
MNDEMEKFWKGYPDICPMKARNTAARLTGVPTYFQIGFLLNNSLKRYTSQSLWYRSLTDSLTNFEDPFHKNYLNWRASTANKAASFKYRIITERNISKLETTTLLESPYVLLTRSRMFLAAKTV